MLIKCSECGKEISDKAISCPNCGNPISQSQQQNVAETKPYIAIAHGGRAKVKTPLLDAACIFSLILCAFTIFGIGFMPAIGFVVSVGWYVIFSYRDYEASKDPMQDPSHLENMRRVTLAYLIIYCVALCFCLWIRSQI